ncbi:hypothetical protein [Prevotella sp. P2-180]|uniref:hypothetical protein n=1 Tax=Prevotella sp. P2-180 TaxID=2024224 RepID=UPI001554319F|nr:hypothetical protein [Prevotella sp. P2-180]
MNIKKQTLKEKQKREQDIRAKGILTSPMRENNHEAQASKSSTRRFRSENLIKDIKIKY